MHFSSLATPIGNKPHSQRMRHGPMENGNTGSPLAKVQMHVNTCLDALRLILGPVCPTRIFFHARDAELAPVLWQTDGAQSSRQHHRHGGGGTSRSPCFLRVRTMGHCGTSMYRSDGNIEGEKKRADPRNIDDSQRACNPQPKQGTLRAFGCPRQRSRRSRQRGMRPQRFSHG